ncbi:hypothetical protein N7536_009013 [Penicillium majusculum]|nr:hypothetical protein N7536_009013 [Penicillium majusculum]
MTCPNIPCTADYPIVGGGIAGLVVACRLSEDPGVRIVLLDGGPMPRMTVEFQNSKHGTLGADRSLSPKFVATTAVILAAGALHTSKLLELSGIGDKYILNRLGISLVSDQPAVGESLHNNVTSMFPVPLNPHPDSEGICLGFKGVTFAHLDQQEQRSPDEASAVL